VESQYCHDKTTPHLDIKSVRWDIYDGEIWCKDMMEESIYYGSQNNRQGTKSRYYYPLLNVLFCWLRQRLQPHFQKGVAWKVYYNWDVRSRCYYGCFSWSFISIHISRMDIIPHEKLRMNSMIELKDVWWRAVDVRFRWWRCIPPSILIYMYVYIDIVCEILLIMWYNSRMSSIPFVKADFFPSLYEERFLKIKMVTWYQTSTLDNFDNFIVS